MAVLWIGDGLLADSSVPALEHYALKGKLHNIPAPAPPGGGGGGGIAAAATSLASALSGEGPKKENIGKRS